MQKIIPYGEEATTDAGNSRRQEKMKEIKEEQEPPPTPPETPVPEPSPWRPNSGMQVDNSKFGPKKPPDLLIFDKSLPDGSTRGNKLPPVTETRMQSVNNVHVNS